MAKAISARSNQTTEREQVKYDIFHLLCERGIRTPQELDFFFREYLELNLPKKRICSNHLSPFEIICDIFFSQPPMSLWISSRGSGKTRTLANLDTIMLLTKPDYNIIHSAAIQAQTNQAYNYFLASHKYKGIKDMVDGDPTRDKTKFLNQSQISLITMTYQGTNSPHVPYLAVDEIELIRDWGILQEAFCIPQTHRFNGTQYKSQTVMMSTRKWDDGIVSRIVEEAKTRNIRVYESCVYEVLEKCTRQCFADPTYGDCPVYTKKNEHGIEFGCQGLAHQCEGFYTIDDFIEKFIQLDYETIETQILCRKPVGYKGAYVYGNLMNDGVQIVDWRFFKDATGYDRPPAEWKRIAGVDFESVFGYGMAAIEPMNGRRWVYSEYYWDGTKRGLRLLEEHSRYIREQPNWNRNVRAFCDPSAKQEIFELNRKGVPCVKCTSGEIRMGVDEVKSLLQLDDTLKTPKLLFIQEEVPNLIRDMKGWTFFRDKDGNVDYDNYGSEDDHGADIVRYMNYGYKNRNRVFAKRGKNLYGRK